MADPPAPPLHSIPGQAVAGRGWLGQVMWFRVAPVFPSVKRE